MNFFLIIELWFTNQTYLKSIVGQEGEPMNITCSSEPKRYTSALKLETNGTVKAIGKKHTVRYAFIPDRTDHLTHFQCLDSNHSSIMIEVELSIRCKYVGT